MIITQNIQQDEGIMLSLTYTWVSMRSPPRQSRGHSLEGLGEARPLPSEPTGIILQNVDVAG